MTLCDRNAQPYPIYTFLGARSVEVYEDTPIYQR